MPKPGAFERSGNGATWRSGYAPDCKSVYPGSIPGVASNPIEPTIHRAMHPPPLMVRLAVLVPCIDRATYDAER